MLKMTIAVVLMSGIFLQISEPKLPITATNVTLVQNLTYNYEPYKKMSNKKKNQRPAAYLCNMNIDELLSDKTLKPKEKTETISRWLLEEALAMDELISIAEKLKDPGKATCIEAIEFATKQRPDLADEGILRFVTGTLSAKAPRIKWESAKVIGNIAHLFPGQLEKSAIQLLENAVHEGTVVRWSAAYALGEILKTKTALNKKLLPQLEQICEMEEKNSIRKIYQAAFKKII